MHAQMPVWVEYVRALGTPIAAIIFGAIAAWISYRQWEISKYKYRFELFDRRYKMYSAVQELFAELMREDKISPEVFSRFAVAANEAKFLFGDEIDAYLSRVTDALVEKRNFDRKFSRGNLSDEQFKQLSEGEDKNWDGIFEKMKEAKTIFSKYLKVPK